MKRRLSLIAFALIASAALVAAQGPGQPGGKGGAKKGKEPSPDLVEYVLSFGKKQPGQVSKEELTDRRLLYVFEQADVNKDGIVTREELTTFAAKLTAEEQGAGKGPGGKGKDGRGPKGPPPGSP